MGVDNINSVQQQLSHSFHQHLVSQISMSAEKAVILTMGSLGRNEASLLSDIEGRLVYRDSQRVEKLQHDLLIIHKNLLQKDNYFIFEERCNPIDEPFNTIDSFITALLQLDDKNSSLLDFQFLCGDRQVYEDILSRFKIEFNKNQLTLVPRLFSLLVQDVIKNPSPTTQEFSVYIENYEKWKRIQQERDKKVPKIYSGFKRKCQSQR